jgi:hypothetical protein
VLGGESQFKMEGGGVWRNISSSEDLSRFKCGLITLILCRERSESGFPTPKLYKSRPGLAVREACLNFFQPRH